MNLQDINIPQDQANLYRDVQAKVRVGNQNFEVNIGQSAPSTAKKMFQNVHKTSETVLIVFKGENSIRKPVSLSSFEYNTKEDCLINLKKLDSNLDGIVKISFQLLRSGVDQVNGKSTQFSKIEQLKTLELDYEKKLETVILDLKREQFKVGNIEKQLGDKNKEISRIETVGGMFDKLKVEYKALISESQRVKKDNEDLAQEAKDHQSNLDANSTQIVI